MEFTPHKAIFLQIADLMCENILLGKWPEDGRVPSVRDLAVALEVNPNTVMRTYTYLQDQGIISTSRGIGYFVADQAHKKVIALKREEFIELDLPRLLKTMELLGMDFKELKQLLDQKSRSKNTAA
jgi:DNA-binding transcriptional regulator YhcF (GntR family)